MKQLLKTGIPLIKILILLGIILLAFWLGKTAQESEFLKHLVSRFGYLGLFLASVGSGFNVVVPLPVVSFLPLFLEAGLNFFIIILVIALGTTLADSVAYLIGSTSRQIVDLHANQILKWLEGFRVKHHRLFQLVLFVFAALAPVPNEVLLVPLGLTGYKKIEIIPIVLAGNIVFNLLYGFGVTSLFNLL